MEKYSVNISIIVTAHNEGLLAHKTLLSINRAIKRLELSKVSYEILISLDNPDSASSDYFKQYESEANYRVLRVDFKDLSKSRNNAAREAKGKYVAFIDADDLVSENWYADAYSLSEQSNTASIFHPEFSITFGGDNLIWKKRDSSNKTTDTLCLIDNNLWDSPAFAPRSVFLDNPYQPNGNGYGFEDKLFNCQTLGNNIPHKVVPRSILFVRRKETGSLLAAANYDRATVAENKLLDFAAIKTLPLTIKTEPVSASSHIRPIIFQEQISALKHLAKRIHVYAKRLSIYRNITTPLIKKYRISSDVNIYNKYPEWLLSEWKAIHRIENQIFPAKALLALCFLRYTKAV